MYRLNPKNKIVRVKFIIVDNKKMHVVFYGAIDKKWNIVNQSKETLVMLPALGVPSPNIYYKPLRKH